MKSFKSWVLFLHRWVGLITGLVVFIVSITGCVLVFEDEISRMIYSSANPFPERQQTEFPGTERLWQIADENAPENPDYHSYSIRVFDNHELSTEISYYRIGSGYSEFDSLKVMQQIYLNPYTGEIQARINTLESFAGIITNLHRNLLLGETGRLVVLWSTVIFLFLLITGLILWWPRNWRKNQRDKSFKIRWSAKWKRINYDLHNVPGFYALIPAFIIGFTGLYWYFTPVQKSIQLLGSGEYKIQNNLPADRKAVIENKGDLLWAVRDKYPEARSITLFTQDDSRDSGQIIVEENKWGSDTKIYRWGSETENPAEMEEKVRRQKLSNLNYSIHTGAIGGLAGKVAAFFASMVCAALPVTGFFIFWNRFKR